MTHPSAQDTLEALKKAFSGNDPKQFQTAYNSFLSKFDLFKQSHTSEDKSEDKNFFGFLNPIFGKIGSWFKKTDGAEEILAKAKAAKMVFADLTIAERVEFLNILQQKVAVHADEIALTITAETGKPIDLSHGEMAKGDEWFNFARENAEAQLGLQKGKNNVINSTKPAGVVNVIGAFNYPYALTIGGIVGGLAAGNALVISATSKAPGWAFPFQQAAKEALDEFSKKATTDGKKWAPKFAAVKDDLIQITVGSNRDISANADVVHFVGGDDTGEKIRALRIQNNKHRTILELGGSNVVTVMKSAITDDNRAKEIAKTIYAGFAPATGQRCTAPRILCIQEGAEAVSEHITELCDPDNHSTDDDKAKIGNPFEKGTKMGPLVDKTAYERMTAAIALANKIGASVWGDLDVSSNQIPMAMKDAQGNPIAYWVNPIAIDWSTAKNVSAVDAAALDALLKNEIFGPLIHIIHPVKTLDEAIEKTNSLDSHKLAAAIFTTSNDEAATFIEKAAPTSKAINGAPKDVSPDGPHGHPGEALIGGQFHFLNYATPCTFRNMDSKIPLR